MFSSSAREIKEKKCLQVRDAYAEENHTFVVFFDFKKII